MLLITGATGNTGLRVLEYLNQNRKYTQIKCFVRKESNIELHKQFDLDISYAYGDLDNVDDIVSALEGVDEVLHIVNIRFSRNVIKACETVGVNRMVMVHTTGKFSKFRECADEYVEIEEDILTNCQLNYTIIRPTMIYGNEMDKNIHKLFKYLNSSKIMPVFGSGQSLLQPINVDDLAKACIDVMDNENCYNNDYNVSGATVIAYIDLIDAISTLLSRKIIKIKIPMWISVFLVKIYTIIMPNPKIKVEQVKRLNEDKSYSHKKAEKDFGFKPMGINDGLESEFIRLKEVNIL